LAEVSWRELQKQRGSDDFAHLADEKAPLSFFSATIASADDNQQ
jgi:hypothetical protein